MCDTSSLLSSTNRLEKLLDGSLISLYWLGFILADGYLSDKHLEVRLSIDDTYHLEKFRAYIEHDHPIRQYKTNYKERTAVNLHVTNIQAVTEIRRVFYINDRKTYNPPSFTDYKLTDTQFMALIIGYIDGDGHINKNLGLKLEVHVSWKNNLEFLNSLVHTYFGYAIRNHVRVNKRGYVFVSIGTHDLVRDVYTFAINHGLPLLDRKWAVVSTRKSKRAKKIRINNEEFESISAAAAHIGMSISWLAQRAQRAGYDMIISPGTLRPRKRL